MNIFRKKIFSSHKAHFGLDLGDLSLKAMRIERTEKRDRIISVGYSTVPSGRVNAGEIENFSTVSSFVQSMLDSAVPEPITLKNVVCSLPETKAFLRVLHIPNMDEAEIEEAIKWEMEANIPMPITDVYYDWQILPETLSSEKTQMSILVVAVACPIVDSVVSVLETAGLTVSGLEIESIAQARSLLLPHHKEKTVLIADIGDRRTGFLIVHHGIPVFTSSISLSGQSITDAIASGMRLSLQEAEKTKIQYGIGSPAKTDELFSSVSHVLENFVQEISRTITFYLSELAYSSSIDEIILCGGGANTKGLLPFLSQRLQAGIHVGEPWSNLRLGKNLPPVPKDSAIRYAVAVGLAMKSLDYGY